MNSSKFAERLKELVEESEMTAAEIGDKLGLGNSAISHYTTERYLPNLQTTIKLADYFSCSIDYLLGLKDDTGGGNFKSCPPFCERFDVICKEKGITRYKLKELANVSETTMRYWVKGKTLPSLSCLILVAKKLNCSIDYLLGRES